MNSLIYQLPKDKEPLDRKFENHKLLFNREVLAGVWSIFDEIARDRDAGIQAMTRKFDGVQLDRLVMSDEEVDRSIDSLSSDTRSAIERAIHNVREVNELLLPKSWDQLIRPGTTIGENVSPLDSVGIWIPSRKGPLLSTAIMLVTAAKVAGVGNIMVGLPPQANGLGDPGTVAAAKLAGADGFVIGNGVSIIAAFAQGTESVPEVDGIFGPGPGGIAAAMSVAMTFGKKSVLGIGPTESVILTDDSADPLVLAYDLMNEGEHGPDSSSLLVTTSLRLARQVESNLLERMQQVEPMRRSNLQSVFGPSGKGAIIVVPDMERACAYINQFAPEHVMIVCEEDSQTYILDHLKHAGEILIGAYTPFSAANYAIGITAVLPTNHYAKAFSGITSKEMVKVSTIGKLDQNALRELYPIVKQLGEYEQLPCHINAAAIRLDGLAE